MELELKPQIELLANKLKQLKQNVTKKDRETVHNTTTYSFPTISSYLSGKGKDADTAATLIDEFTKLIEARAKKGGIKTLKRPLAKAV